MRNSGGSNDSDIICVMRVPTIQEEPQCQPKVKEINVNHLNEDDLKKLKTQDPFLYYSIPGVSKAKLSGTPVDHTKVLQESLGSVQRKTRVSTESDPSISLGDIDDVRGQGAFHFDPCNPTNNDKQHQFGQ